jgi:hypothetical protein
VSPREHARVETSHKEADMGHSTDFIRHIDINARVNDDGIAYLAAFARSRRRRRPVDPRDNQEPFADPPRTRLRRDAEVIPLQRSV